MPYNDVDLVSGGLKNRCPKKTKSNKRFSSVWVLKLQKKYKKRCLYEKKKSKTEKIKKYKGNYGFKPNNLVCFGLDYCF